MTKRLLFPYVIGMEGGNIVLGQIGPPKPPSDPLPTSNASLTEPSKPKPDPAENIPAWFCSSEHLPGLHDQVFGEYAIW